MSRRLVSALALTAALSLSLAACQQSSDPKSDMPPLPTSATAPVTYVKDIHSYAQPQIARVKHVDLDLTADFAAKTLSGTAILDVTAEAGATQIVLDVRDLDIKGVRGPDDQPLTFVLGAVDPILGQSLTIDFPAFTAGEMRKIKIDYSTKPEAAALQWLTPAQTSGGQKPYLFSQGQAILTRTWIPTQDSPGIRQTWSARITAPKDLTVVMAAEHLTPNGENETDTTRSWRFRMTNPVAPYLIAVGAGDIKFASTGPRTGVFTEPGQLEADTREFAEIEKMVAAAETLYGPYRWGRFDLLVLPPSFPFGGMENPRLTFATPTVVAGDRSLVSLVAHELAHSWSGNQVTNATWADFWLNEGFTTYAQNRIMEVVYGADRAQQERVLGWDSLQEQLKSLPAADTRLKLDLTGRDPDDGMTDIAYEKGAAFLDTIERIVGRERFDAWLNGYIERHAFTALTSEQFLQDIRANLVKGDAALEAQLQLDNWVYQPGLPSNAVAPTSNAFVEVDNAARAFFADRGAAAAIPWAGWNTQQRQRFLGWRPANLRSGADWLTNQQLADLEKTLGLANAGNSEITFAWLQIAVAHRYQPAVPRLEQFLTSMGRRKFVLPLFTSLWAEGDWGRPLATSIYAKARPGYHPVTTNSVDALLGRPAA
jgi:leukotriene-A4 hydrolase